MKKLFSILLVFVLTLATFSLCGLIETKASNVTSSASTSPMLQQLVGSYKGYYDYQGYRYGVKMNVYVSYYGDYYALLNTFYISNHKQIAFYRLPNIYYYNATKKYKLVGYKQNGNSNSNGLTINGTLVGNTFSGTMLSDTVSKPMKLTLNKVSKIPEQF